MLSHSSRQVVALALVALQFGKFVFTSSLANNNEPVLETWESGFDIVDPQSTATSDGKADSKSTSPDELSDLLNQLRPTRSIYSSLEEPENSSGQTGSQNGNCLASDSQHPERISFNDSILKDALLEMEEGKPNESGAQQFQMDELLAAIQTELGDSIRVEKNPSPGLTSNCNDEEGYESGENRIGYSSLKQLLSASPEITNNGISPLCSSSDEKKIFELPNVNKLAEIPHENEILNFYGILLSCADSNPDLVEMEDSLRLSEQFQQIHTYFRLENPSNLLNILSMPLITSISTEDYIEIVSFCISTYRSSFAGIFHDWFAVIRHLSSAPVIVEHVLMLEQELFAQLLQLEPYELEKNFAIGQQKEAFCIFYFQHRLFRSPLIHQAVHKMKILIGIKNGTLVNSQLLCEIISFIKEYKTVSGFMIIALLEYAQIHFFKETIDYALQLRHKLMVTKSNELLKFVEIEIFWMYLMKHSYLNSMAVLVAQLLEIVSLDTLVSLANYCIVPYEIKYLQVLVALCGEHEHLVVRILLEHRLIDFPESFINWFVATPINQYSITKIILSNLPTFRMALNNSKFQALLLKVTNQNLLRRIYQEANEKGCVQLTIELKKRIDLRAYQPYFRSTDSIEELIKSSIEPDVLVDNLLVMLACASKAEHIKMANFLKEKNQKIYEVFINRSECLNSQ